MKTKFTIPSKLKPSFKGWVYIIIILFFIPFIGVFINYATSLYLGDLYTFGISDRKDFFTIWIALFGAIGIAFNIYQNQKRTKNQEEQLEKQQTQIDLQSKSQRDSRFSKGIELLSNDDESARTGAAYSLYFLAKDYPNEFSKPVFDILCSRVRIISNFKKHFSQFSLVELQTIIDLLFKNSLEDERIGNVLFSQYMANLEGADLSEINLNGANLRKANLKDAYLEMAKLKKSNLGNINLMGADLIAADLFEANLKRANLIISNLSSTNLSKADLSKADLSGANLSGANLKGSLLKEANLIGADLNKANLNESHLNGASIYSSMKEFLEQSGVDLSDVNWIDEERS